MFTLVTLGLGDPESWHEYSVGGRQNGGDPMRCRAFVVALSVTLSAGLMGSAVSCGVQGESAPRAERNAPPSPPPSAAPSDSVELENSPNLEEIRKRGKLLVGLRSNDPPFAVRKGPGEYGGFDVEMAKIIAQGIGLDPETGIAYRWLPPSMLTDAMVAGNVDVQIGGFDPATLKTANVGPYIVTGGNEHFIGIRPGDDVMRAELQRILDTAVAEGKWRRAYDATLGAAGIAGTPR